MKAYTQGQYEPLVPPSGWTEQGRRFVRQLTARFDELFRKTNSVSKVARTGKYEDLIDKPDIPVIPELAKVATTGDYEDLTNKPSIPTSSVVSSWGFVKSTEINPIPNGTYTYSTPDFSGFISNSSKDIRFYVPTGYIKGKNVSFDFKGNTTIRSIHGYAMTTTNTAGGNIAQSELKKCAISIIYKSDFGFTVLLQNYNASWYRANSETSVTNNTPMNLQFSTVNVTIS